MSTEDSEQLEESARSFWEIAHEQLAMDLGTSRPRNLEEIILDPDEREDMLKIQRLRRAS